MSHHHRSNLKPTPAPNNTGLRRIFSAFINTKKGLLWMLKNEAAFQQELILFGLAVPTVMALNLSNPERVALVGSILLILIIETINTGIEAVVDRIGPEYHELSGLAKDCGSAAVFLSFILAFLIWVTVLL